MKKIFTIAMISVLISAGSCKKDSDFLNVPPKSVVTTDVVFSDPALVLSVLGDLYNRVLDFSSLDNGWTTFADFGESFPSDNGQYGFVQNRSWDYGAWGTWDYGYVRDLNLFIDNVTASTKLLAADKSRFLAEGRFLRASYYFEMVKRMGGVPIITTQLIVDDKNDVASLQRPTAGRHATR